MSVTARGAQGALGQGVFVPSPPRGHLTFLLPDGRILAVGQRAGGAVAQPRQVVLIAAEILRFCPGKER